MIQAAISQVANNSRNINKYNSAFTMVRSPTCATSICVSPIICPALCAVSTLLILFQLPLGLLTAAQGHPMLVELKNGETLNGHLVTCDTWMNLTLKEVVQTSPVCFLGRCGCGALGQGWLCLAWERHANGNGGSGRRQVLQITGGVRQGQ